MYAHCYPQVERANRGGQLLVELKNDNEDKTVVNIDLYWPKIPGYNLRTKKDYLPVFLTAHS